MGSHHAKSQPYTKLLAIKLGAALFTFSEKHKRISPYHSAKSNMTFYRKQVASLLFVNYYYYYYFKDEDMKVEIYNHVQIIRTFHC